MNELIDANRRDKRAGNRLKQQSQDTVRFYIYRDLPGLRIEGRVFLQYRFYEKNRRRDLDNISGFAHKVTQDALVHAGVLKNDGWAHISGMQDSFYVDAKRPRIEVIIREVDEDGGRDQKQRNPAPGGF